MNNTMKIVIEGESRIATLAQQVDIVSSFGMDYYMSMKEIFVISKWNMLGYKFQYTIYEAVDKAYFAIPITN